MPSNSLFLIFRFDVLPVLSFVVRRFSFTLLLRLVTVRGKSRTDLETDAVYGDI